MKTGLKITLIAGVLGLLALAAWAQGPLKNPKVIQELGLTPDQVQKLEDLKYQHQRQMIDIRHDLSLKRLELNREMEKDTPDRAKINRLLDETSALKGQQQKLRTNHRLDASQILTPEQRVKAREMMAERRARRGERRMERRREFRGGDGPGYGPGPGSGGPPPQAPGAREGAEWTPPPGSGPEGHPAPDFAGMMDPEGAEPLFGDFDLEEPPGPLP
jgi:Spy/CpxP family protein refolding chaperone